MPTVITVYPASTTTGPAPSDSVVVPTAARLLRAVDESADFRWFAIADYDNVKDADAAVAAVPDTALCGTYEVFHVGTHAAPPFRPDTGPDSVTFINCFRFAPLDFDAAYDVWASVNAYMVAKPGYRWHRLHRRLHDDAPFGFINVVEWESIPAWTSAHDAGLRALLAAAGDLPFTNVPTLCLPVRSDRTAETVRNQMS
jgi:hypothetical protein